MKTLCVVVTLAVISTASFAKDAGKHTKRQIYQPSYQPYPLDFPFDSPIDLGDDFDFRYGFGFDHHYPQEFHHHHGLIADPQLHYANNYNYYPQLFNNPSPRPFPDISSTLGSNVIKEVPPPNLSNLGGGVIQRIPNSNNEQSTLSASVTPRTPLYTNTKTPLSLYPSLNNPFLIQVPDPEPQVPIYNGVLPGQGHLRNPSVLRPENYGNFGQYPLPPRADVIPVQEPAGPEPYYVPPQLYRPLVSNPTPVLPGRASSNTTTSGFNQRVPSAPVSLGSGSLGIVSLPNGGYALGSGSLGYVGNQPQPQPQQQSQQQQPQSQQQSTNNNNQAQQSSVINGNRQRLFGPVRIAGNGPLLADPRLQGYNTGFLPVNPYGLQNQGFAPLPASQGVPGLGPNSNLYDPLII